MGYRPEPSVQFECDDGCAMGCDRGGKHELRLVLHSTSDTWSIEIDGESWVSFGDNAFSALITATGNMARKLDD
jgi:hypothetical protein